MARRQVSLVQRLLGDRVALEGTARPETVMALVRALRAEGFGVSISVDTPRRVRRPLVTTRA